MQSQPGIMSPPTHTIRDPRDAGMKNGRTHNPPRYQTLGGLTGPGKWPEKSDYAVESPTRISGGKRAYEKKI